ncbi:MAG: hypothetical protein KJN67_05815 [Pontiella sp.]|nr:hypothetical protein [Pontiella sp.]
MKPSQKWLKVARRGMLITISACCVVALSGCLHDDDDNDLGILYFWDVVWIDNVDPADSGDVTIPLQWGDLNAITSYSDTIAGYDISVSRSGAIVTVVVNDTSSLFNITITLTINSPTDGSGTYTGTSSSGAGIGGTGTIIRQ